MARCNKKYLSREHNNWEGLITIVNIKCHIECHAYNKRLAKMWGGIKGRLKEISHLKTFQKIAAFQKIPIGGYRNGG